MVIAVTKRSGMTFYSDPADIYSHRCRIVLAEKGVTVDIVDIDPQNKPEDLLELNPYNTLPTLIDRDLVLYESSIIMEYLDERFPHPPLLPVYPVSRAKSRLMNYRIERDWYSLINKIEQGDAAAREELKNGIISIAPVFGELPYFLSEEFTLVDCCIAPLLWRLPLYDIELPRTAKPIFEYQERVFNRESFQVSLTEAEREIREKDDI